MIAFLLIMTSLYVLIFFTTSPLVTRQRTKVSWIGFFKSALTAIALLALSLYLRNSIFPIFFNGMANYWTASLDALTPRMMLLLYFPLISVQPSILLSTTAWLNIERIIWLSRALFSGWPMSRDLTSLTSPLNLPALLATLPLFITALRCAF
jgi:hypothetical protein